MADTDINQAEGRDLIIVIAIVLVPLGLLQDNLSMNLCCGGC